MKRSVVVLICFLLITITANAQSRSGRCQVTSSWWDPRQNIGSGITELDQFYPVVAEARTFKTYKSDMGLIVTVGIEYELSNSSRFREVRVMITASKKEVKNIFGLVESSEASTAFKKRWYLTVSKRIAIEDKEYRFELRCWDNVKFPK